MNKKLLAVAVAGALAAPGAAMAQVTISGIFKVGITAGSIDNASAARANDSELRVDDNSSRILFNASEDLGGGLSAIGQFDVRFAPDQAGTAPASNPIGSGNTYVGLRSTSWGTVSLGRWDLHYGKQPDDIATKAGALMASSVSLMDFHAAGTIPVANATRTANVIKWDSPNWGGFQLTAAYSTAPLAAASEADMSTTAAGSKTDSGDGMNLQAQFTAANWQIGASMWDAKAEAGTAATAPWEQDSQAVWGYIRFGGFKVGAAMNVATLQNSAGADISDRTSYTVPASFTTGPHNFYAHYTIADDDDATVAEDGATMIAFAYVYDLSKRTSVGITYAMIDNDDFGRYTPFTGGGLAANGGMLAGEDPTIIQATLRHAF